MQQINQKWQQSNLELQQSAEASMEHSNQIYQDIEAMVRRSGVLIAHITEAWQNQVHEEFPSQVDVADEDEETENEKEETEEKVKEAEDVPFEVSLIYKEFKPYVPSLLY
ncbi:hypothetical protein QYF36_005008 [Acer negundo]|nr:hypothetical protein QYF36_005008 [Acer negundo]